MLTTKLSEIITELNDNKIVSLPTETVYGLFVKVSPTNATLLNELKNRQSNHLLQIFVKDLATLKAISALSDFQEMTIPNYLPGPNSVIVEPNKVWKEANLPRHQATICLRVVDPKLTPFLFEIIANVGPLFSTSTNLTGQKPLNNPEEISHQFNILTLIVAKNLMINLQPSRIISLLNDKIKIIRE